MQNINIPKKDKNVCVVVLNVVQYESIRPAIELMEKNGLFCDVIIPDYKRVAGADLHIAQMFDETYRHLRKTDSRISRSAQNTNQYRVTFMPYPMDWLVKIDSQYFVRYLYGLVTKPEIAFNVLTNTFFDAIMCMSPYDSSFLETYSKTHIIGPIKYASYRNSPKKNRQKKTLLYLPTYGDLSSITTVLPKLMQMKKKYALMIKVHHMTSYISEEREILKKARTVGRVYNHKTSLLDLLREADVVLSDNSGAIWDAVIANVPVAIFRPSKELFLNAIPTLQYELVKNDIIPGTSDINDLDNVVNRALNHDYFLKQQKLKHELFPVSGREGLKILLKVVKSMINNTYEPHYMSTHNMLRNYILGAEQRIREVELSNQKLMNTKTFQFANEVKKLLNRVGIKMFQSI